MSDFSGEVLALERPLEVALRNRVTALVSTLKVSDVTAAQLEDIIDTLLNSRDVKEVYVATCAALVLMTAFEWRQAEPKPSAKVLN